MQKVVLFLCSVALCTVITSAADSARSCGDPGYVKNGFRIGNIFIFPNKVEFHCQEGFKLRGSKELQCQADGEWSGRLPRCAPIYCSAPSDPENGYVFFPALHYGTELEYGCDKGFMLQNYQQRICSEDGTWSNNEPECIEIECQVPEAPAHGSVEVSEEPMVGSVATYSCDENATLTGPSTSTCLSTGEWTSHPKCLRSCKIPAIQNGKLGRNQTVSISRLLTQQRFISLPVGKSIKHNEIVIIQCKLGFTPGDQTTDRTDETVCYDGAWSKTLKCEEHNDFCGSPPEIDDVIAPILEGSEHPVGTVIIYQCPYGHVSQSPSNLRSVCKYDERTGKPEWTLPNIRCIPQSCGDPGYVNNGRRIGNLFTFPGRVKFECDEGFSLQGSIALQCQADGEWSGRLPHCEHVTCEKPHNPDNGYVTYSSLEYGSELTYKCDKGFRLNTDETVFCNSSGSWSITDVECIESVCDYPLPPEHGSVELRGTEDNPRAGSVALFSCDGYRIPVGSTTSRCLDTGEWTFPTPKCLGQCIIPYVDEGIIGRYRRDKMFTQVEVSSAVVDDLELVLRCSEGYQVSDSEKREERISCSHGKWSRELQCELARCRTEPPSIMNGQIIAYTAEYGGSVLYFCDPGFKKTAHENLVCDYGKWKGSVPICISEPCIIPYVADGNIIKYKKQKTRRKRVFDMLEVGASVDDDTELFIRCSKKYEVSDSDKNEEKISCSHGKWSRKLQCKPASCRTQPPSVQNGQVKAFISHHSGGVLYSCNPSFKMTKFGDISCDFGKWKGSLPVCQSVNCTIPLLPHGEIRKERSESNFNWKSLRHDKSINYEKIPPGTVVPYKSALSLFCNQGYSFEGTEEERKEITCINGRWQPHPVCLLDGMEYTPHTTINNFPSMTPLLQISNPRKINLTITDATSVSKPTTVNNYNGVSPDEEEIPTVEPPVEDCYCEYPINDDNLVAYADGKILQFHDKVKDGSTVVLRCNLVEFHQLVGPQEIRCENCRKWYASEFPMCLEPEYGIITDPTSVSKPPTVNKHSGVPPDEEEIPTAEPPEEECYCEYPETDENLVAHADGKRLQFQDKVKDGSAVVFRCKLVGFHQLVGPQEIRCENCWDWQASEFPRCILPKRGDAVILYDSTLNVLTEGNLEAKKGQNIKLVCVGIETDVYPQWDFPTETGVTVTIERRERESLGDILYVSQLEIHEADLENKGQYGCAIEDNPMTSVNIVITDLSSCSKILKPPDSKLTVKPQKDVYKPGDVITFSCIPGYILNAQSELSEKWSCLKSGKWSETVLPDCQDADVDDYYEVDYISEE